MSLSLVPLAVALGAAGLLLAAIAHTMSAARPGGKPHRARR